MDHTDDAKDSWSNYYLQKGLIKSLICVVQFVVKTKMINSSKLKTKNLVITATAD